MSLQAGLGLVVGLMLCFVLCAAAFWLSVVAYDEYCVRRQKRRFGDWTR
jgi:hypothetical protein